MRIEFVFSKDLSSNLPSKDYIKQYKCAQIETFTEVSQEDGVYKVLLITYTKENGLEKIDHFASKKSFDVFAFVSHLISKKDLEELRETLYDIITHPGVLEKRQIDTLLKFHILLYGLDSPNAKPAKCDLTLSREYFAPLHGNELQKAFGKGIAIPPLGFLLVMANEYCNFPRNICGIFDLRVSIFCQGIILANGVQVDPGYRGVLLSLLFNSSSTPQSVTVDSSFSSLMFFTLSSRGAIYEGDHLNSSSIADYLPKMIPQGFSYDDFTKHGEDIKSIYNDLASHKTKIDKIEGMGLTKATVLIAAIAILCTLFAGSPIVYNWARIDEVKDTYNKIKPLEKYHDDIEYLKGRVDELSGLIEELDKKEKLNN